MENGGGEIQIIKHTLSAKYAGHGTVSENEMC